MDLRKKGSAVLDGAIIAAILVAMVILVFFVYRTISDINIDIQADPDYGSTSKTISAANVTTYRSFWDMALPFLLVMFWIIALVTAWNIDSSALFFIFSVIGIIVILIACMSLEAYYRDVLTDSDYAGYDTLFPMVNFLMNHLVWIIMVICFSIGVVLHSKL